MSSLWCWQHVECLWGLCLIGAILSLRIHSFIHVHTRLRSPSGLEVYMTRSSGVLAAYTGCLSAVICQMDGYLACPPVTRLMMNICALLIISVLEISYESSWILFRSLLTSGWIGCMNAVWNSTVTIMKLLVTSTTAMMNIAKMSLLATYIGSMCLKGKLPLSMWSPFNHLENEPTQRMA